MNEASKAARLWGSILVIVFAAGALVGRSTSGTATAPSTPTPATGTAQPPPTSAATTQAGASVPVDAHRAAIPLGDADLPDGWVVADKHALSGLLEGCTSGLLADGGAGASGQQFADEDASGSFASMGYVLTSIAGASQAFDDLNGAADAVSDGRNIDRVTFVREGGEWLIDRVRLTSFE